MNIKEKDKLKHDFLNSVVNIKNLSKSAATFIDKIFDKETTVSDNQLKFFKTSMLSIQQELICIESFFNEALADCK